MNYKTVYLGTSIVALEILCKYEAFKLEYVICENKRLTTQYQQIASMYNKKIVSFVNKEDLCNILDTLVEFIEIFIIYQFDFILPYKIASTNKFFNFHSGSLLTNRGAHPIIRSILNGDAKTELTLHRINEKIDQGLIIGTFEVEITNSDDTFSLKEKTEKGIIPLLKKLLLFQEGEIQPITIDGGIYHKPIKELDFTINIEDTEQQIVNKIRSQKQYKGALVIHNGERYYIDEVKRSESNLKEDKLLIINKDRIIMNRGNICLILSINNKP